MSHLVCKILFAKLLSGHAMLSKYKSKKKVLSEIFKKNSNNMENFVDSISEFSKS